MTPSTVTPADRIVMFSGGAGSWGAAKRVAEEHGTDGLVLLFADTLIEDEDLYRFLDEAAANVGGELVRLADGRTPWEVFRDVKFLGNTRADPCSRILKRDLIRDHVEETYDPDTTVIYMGIDWSEYHRLERVQEAWEPWPVEAPMCEEPYMSKSEVLAWMKREGIDPPRLYDMGFPHNNCGGGCVKAGQAHWKLLYEQMPERYQWWEDNEQEIREELGDVAILRDRTDGWTRPMTLKEFRVERLEKQAQQIDLLEWGGCGCFVDVEDDE